MRNKSQWITMLGVGLLALPAMAQPPRDGDGPPPPDPEMKQKMLDTFDTNHDGSLDGPERRQIRRAMQEFFPGGPEGPRPAARGGREGGPPPEADRGPEGRRGPRGEAGPPRDRERARNRERNRGDRGPEGRRGRGDGAGPPRQPRPERLFNAFDEDDNDQLSLDEFRRLTDFMRDRLAMNPPPQARGRGPRPDGPPRGGEFGRRGPRGPEGRRPPRPEGPPPEGRAPEEAADDPV